jgi:FKBP-type peptidyl-prolyl cis-trans isomerase
MVIIASIAVIALIIGAVIVLRGGAGAPSETPTPTAVAKGSGASPAPGKLIVTDQVVGTGAEAKADSTVKAKYTGKLADGTVFDSTDKHGGEAIEFPLSNVIKGWQEGIPGMKVGGKRTLVIPPDLGYGEQGTQGIPPNSTLTFEIELVDVK